MPFHTLPVIDLLGPVRTGEGIIWWLNISILSCGMLVLWKIPVYRRLVIITSLLGFLTCYGLTLTHIHFRQPYTPFFFADYLAFNVIAFIPVLWLTLKNHLKPLPRSILIYIVINAFLIGTSNKTMIAFGLTFPLAIALFESFKFIPRTLTDRLHILGLIVLPIVLFIIFVGIAHIFDNHGYYGFENNAILRTFASRAYLIQVITDQLVSHPENLLTGNGWGQYTDQIAQHLPLKWLDLTFFDGTQWDGLITDHFHPHNMYVATLSASGLVGLTLFFLYILGFHTTAKTAIKPIATVFCAGFIVWASLWFFFPVNIPFMILAGAALANNKTFKRPNTRIFNKKILAAGLLIILILQLWASYVSQKTAYMGGHYESNELTITEAATFNDQCPVRYYDYGAGGLRLSRKLLDRLRFVESLFNKILVEEYGYTDADRTPEIVRSHITSINHLLCETAHYKNTHPTTYRLKIAVIMARGELLLGFDNYLSDEEKIYYKTGWKEDLLEWLSLAPKRSDQAIPFLLYNILNAQEQNSSEIIDLILANNPQDPVGLWFKGLSMLNDPARTQSGLAMMRKALDNGLGKLMPVEPELLQILGK